MKKDVAAAIITGIATIILISIGFEVDRDPDSLYYFWAAVALGFPFNILCLFITAFLFVVFLGLATVAGTGSLGGAELFLYPIISAAVVGGYINGLLVSRLFIKLRSNKNS
jgi:hypothetical protein